MKLTNRQIIGLPVVSQSDQSVGHIIGFECNSENHLILNYLVSASPLVTRLLHLPGKELVIAVGQVVSLDAERMVVVDSSVAEAISVTQPLAARPKPAPPITPSTLE